MEKVVNITKASTICNIFYVFLSAAKASLLPFLTLFFRLVGLSAWETGVVMAAKTLTSFVWAPLWARCAVTYNKRRLVLIFSIFMMGIMYLSFIPVYYKVGTLPACAQQNLNGSLQGNISAPTLQKGTQDEGHSNRWHSQLPPVSNTTTASKFPTTVRGGLNKTFPSYTLSTPVSVTRERNEASNDTHFSFPTEPTQMAFHRSGPGPQVPVPGSEGSQQLHGPTHVLTEEERVLLNDIDKRLESKGYTLQEIEDIPPEDMVEIIRKLKPEENLTTISGLVNLIKSAKASAAQKPQEPDSYLHSRHARNLNITLWNTMKERFSILALGLEQKKLILFLVILLIVIFGEFFSSPIEKIADDAWFDFLERIDDMEKYGQQRYWGSFAFALVPIVVTMLVDYTPCEVLHLHHFLLHFHIFGIFIIFTFATAFYFPMPPPLKQKYVSKVLKGFRIICCECRGFLFIFTLFIAGMLYASFNNFLFWHLQDLGASELTLGLCVSVAAFAETPMLLLSGKLVRKIGNVWVVALALLVLSLRLLYYGFLWTPWAVLPMELSNSFTHTALWYAILSYSEFNVAPATDRSIRSILSSFYFGLGFAAGSALSGLVFSIYGASVLYWGGSVVAAVWCVIYSIIQRCLPKKEKVKYIRLLRKEENDSSDGEDDWLEMALKDQ